MSGDFGPEPSGIARRVSPAGVAERVACVRTVAQVAARLGVTPQVARQVLDALGLSDTIREMRP